jgi:hypothetical protein
MTRSGWLGPDLKGNSTGFFITKRLNAVQLKENLRCKQCFIFMFSACALRQFSFQLSVNRIFSAILPPSNWLCMSLVVQVIDMM